MKLRPLRDYIVVRPDRRIDHVTEFGLTVAARETLHESATQLGRTGTVLAVGPGRRTTNGRARALAVAVGQRVVFGEFLYPEWSDSIVMQEADVAGVID